MSRGKEQFVSSRRIPMRYNNDGVKIINCEKCNSELPCLGTIDNFYSSHDLYICRICSKGYKAKIFTGLTADQYISIEPALINDIEIIINSKVRLEKFRKKTREEIEAQTPKRGRPRKQN